MTSPGIPRPILVALGKEFRRRGMQNHAEHLASYYRGNQGHRPPYGWDDGHVLTWLKRLRIPPYEFALPALAPASDCPPCGPQSVFGGRRTLCTFPGGAEFICGRCEMTWLELERGPLDVRRLVGV